MNFDEKITAAAYSQGLQIGDAIDPREICVGDVVYMASTPGCSWAGVSESPVIRSRGRVNVVVESRNRYAPDGPWHITQHKIPRSEVR